MNALEGLFVEDPEQVRRNSVIDLPIFLMIFWSAFVRCGICPVVAQVLLSIRATRGVDGRYLLPL